MNARRTWDSAILARCRFRQLANLLDQQLRESPARTFVILVLLFFVWAALHELLAVVFRQVQNWQLVAIVANQQIFVHFFLALAVMLAFSNAVLAFGNLFGRTEPMHLLSLPASPREVVFVKWIEGMFLSSWSFLLLGVPLMLAVANTTTVEWYYYPLFIGHFVGFVLVPSTLGLLAAWCIAMWAPRRPMMIAGIVAAGILSVALIWIWRISLPELTAEEWARRLFAQLSLAKNPLLPSTWTALGIVAALERRVNVSLFYLGVGLANAGFLAWLTINLVGGTWAEAYNRAQQGRSVPTVRNGWVTAGMCALLFFYLPKHLRIIMLKDLRTFARDPTQWTQMVIMLGLLVLYALNLQQLPLDLHDPQLKSLIAFLNLTTVTLILATFTSRFVFPLLSLESQQLWLLGLIPTPRRTLLLVKFIFAFTVTGISGIGVMALATQQLELPAEWVRLHLLISIAVCVGLCGISVGLGARFPVLGQRNPARIAAGFGGTVNLVVSMLFVAIVITSVAIVSYGEVRQGVDLTPQFSQRTWSVVFGLVAFSFLCAAAAMALGARRFKRLEV